jgi:hypothetical protein
MTSWKKSIGIEGIVMIIAPGPKEEIRFTASC